MNDDMFLVPTSVDLNPTAKCNLACTFCWGPDHSMPDSLSRADWTAIIDAFVDMGTKAVVFTGGEPLVRPDIGDLVHHSHDRGLRVTLSTNGIMLKRRADDVLPYVNEIGIPIDGYDASSNGRMRIGTPRAFQCAVDAVRLVSARYPAIEITVRTVVSNVNSGYVERIGELLNGMSAEFDRWKLYQFSSRGIGEKHSAEHGISVAEFRRSIGQVRSRFPALNISAQEELEGTGRYLFVGPDGVVFGVDDEGRYRQAGAWRHGAFDLSAADCILTPAANAAHAQRKAA